MKRIESILGPSGLKEDLEDRISRGIENSRGYIPLGRVIEAKIEDRGASASIHLVFDHDMSPVEKQGEIGRSFRRLAEMLKKDRRFENVQAITATSWIGTEHPKIMERYGFNIDYENQDLIGRKKIKEYKSKGKSIIDPAHKDTPPTFARISKNRFLELYGS